MRRGGSSPMSDTSPPGSDSRVTSVDLEPGVAADIVKADAGFFTLVADQLESMIIVGPKKPRLNGPCDVEFDDFSSSNLTWLQVDAFDRDTSLGAVFLRQLDQR